MANRFQAHGHSANACQWLAGSDRSLVTVSDDKTARVWDLESGTDSCTCVLEGHRDKVVDVCAQGEDRGKVVTASWDRSVRLWDLRQGQSIVSSTVQHLTLSSSKHSHTLSKWFGQHRSIATSCCSSWHHLVVAGLDKSAVLLWDLRSGEEEAELLGHTSTVTCVRCATDDYTLCSTSMDKTARVWDVRMHRCLLQLKGHEHIVSSCTFTTNDHLLCTASWDKSLMLYDVATGEFRTRGPARLVGHEGCISSCAYSPDGSMVASGGYDGLLNVYSDPSKPTPKLSLRGHASWINSVSFSGSGKIIAAAAKNGVVHLWHTDKLLCQGGQSEAVPRLEKLDEKTLECLKCKRVFSNVGFTEEKQCILCRRSTSSEFP